MTRPASRSRNQAPAAGVAVLSGSRWRHHELPANLREEYALPHTLPIPGREAARVDRGVVPFGELARWIEKFLAEEPSHASAGLLRETARRLTLHQTAAELIEGGRSREALDVLRGLSEREPRDRRARFAHAVALCHLGEFDAALAEFAEVEAVFGRAPNFVLMKARALSRTGRVDQALATLKAAHEIDPKNALIARELVVLGYLVPSHFDARRQDQMKYVTREQYENAVRQQVQQLRAKEAWDELVRMGRFQLDDKRPHIAVALAALVLEHKPEHVGALILAGKSELTRDLPGAARTHLDKALALAPDNDEARVALARALVRLDLANEAGELLQSLLARDPNNVEAAELWVLLDPTAEGRESRARQLHDKAPTAWLPHKLLGDLAFARGDLQGALDAHRLSLAIHPADDTMTMILHELDALGRPEEAVKFAEQIPGVMRRSAAVRWNAANVLLRGGRIKGATQVLEGILADRSLPHETRLNANMLLAEVYASTRAR